MKRYIKNVAHTSYVTLTDQRHFIAKGIATEICEYRARAFKRYISHPVPLSIEIIIIYEA